MTDDTPASTDQEASKPAEDKVQGDERAGHTDPVRPAEPEPPADLDAAHDRAS